MVLGHAIFFVKSMDVKKELRIKKITFKNAPKTPQTRQE